MSDKAWVAVGDQENWEKSRGHPIVLLSSGKYLPRELK
jgi:hypothetical protein